MINNDEQVAHEQGGCNVLSLLYTTPVLNGQGVQVATRGRGNGIDIDIELVNQ